MKKIIYLQRIGDLDPRILIILKKDLKCFFKKHNIKVDILAEQLPLLDSEYNSDEDNYYAIDIKKRLVPRVKNNKYYRILGVLDVEIYSTLLKRIFGVAGIPKNKAFGRALISVTRLREEFYRRTRNVALFEQRIFKEAIHELGHTFGLKHCENHCVMCCSIRVDDTDKKPHDFCEICLKKLNSYLN